MLTEATMDSAKYWKPDWWCFTMETDNEPKHSSRVSQGKDTLYFTTAKSVTWPEHNETCDSAAEDKTDGSIQSAFKVWEGVKTLIGPNSVLQGHNFHILHACTCYMCRCSYMLVSYALAVVQEGPEATAVEVIQDRQQEMLVKLEGRRELRGESYNSKTESS